VGTRHKDLIYDVGMNDGADTAFYLHQGYRVLALDADPSMIDLGQRRFVKEIAEGRLTLLNIGIADQPGTATFWVCDDKPEWNSFDRAQLLARNRPHHSIEIPTMPFRQVLDTYGIPHYLKIDIEGHDHYCISDLDNAQLPDYISTEVQAEEDGSLGSLVKAGYRRFKMIRQNGWGAARKPVADWIQHVLTSAAYGRLRPLGLSSLVKSKSDRTVVESNGFSFTEESSGPWGENTPGRWMTADEALATLRAERERVRRSGKPAIQFWWDWHAKGPSQTK